MLTTLNLQYMTRTIVHVAIQRCVKVCFLNTYHRKVSAPFVDTHFSDTYSLAYYVYTFISALNCRRYRFARNQCSTDVGLSVNRSD